VLVETATEHVHATDVIDIKELKADTITQKLSQLLRDGNILFVQVEYFPAVAKNVRDAKDVLAMCLAAT
jgi:hypothetical protein